MEDILGVEKARINEDRLYRAFEVLGRHKEKLCAQPASLYRVGLHAGRPAVVLRSLRWQSLLRDHR